MAIKYSLYKPEIAKLGCKKNQSLVYSQQYEAIKWFAQQTRRTVYRIINSLHCFSNQTNQTIKNYSLTNF